jgi:dihydroflavonol-4-reductase
MIFLTGGSGLLGSHLLIELTKRGKIVRALKRETSDILLVKQLFDFYLKEKSEECYKNITWVNGDINDVYSLQNAIKGCDEVYHCAGYVSFYKKEFNKLMKINRDGTANIVNICLTQGIKKLSYVSSTAAIGRDKKGNTYTEKSKWLTSSENSNYAVSKYLGEMEAWRGQEEGLNISIVNPSIILGAGNWNEGSLSLFINIKKGLKFYTEGVNAFVDARDVATIMVELMEKEIFGERFLLISENVCFKDLFFNIAKEMGIKSPSIKVKPWMASIGWKIEAIKSFFLGSKPKITKETTRSAMSKSYYSNEKIINTINYSFRSTESMIKNSILFNKKYK